MGDFTGKKKQKSLRVGKLNFFISFSSHPHQKVGKSQVQKTTTGEYRVKSGLPIDVRLLLLCTVYLKFLQLVKSINRVSIES